MSLPVWARGLPREACDLGKKFKPTEKLQEYYKELSYNFYLDSPSENTFCICFSVFIYRYTHISHKINKKIYIISINFFLNHLKISCGDSDPSPKYFKVYLLKITISCINSTIIKFRKQLSCTMLLSNIESAFKIGHFYRCSFRVISFPRDVCLSYSGTVPLPFTIFHCLCVFEEGQPQCSADRP